VPDREIPLGACFDALLGDDVHELRVLRELHRDLDDHGRCAGRDDAGPQHDAVGARIARRDALWKCVAARRTRRVFRQAAGETEAGYGRESCDAQEGASVHERSRSIMQRGPMICIRLRRRRSTRVLQAG
jgi:hypothetical protein